jgi:hypothetical protein
MTTVLPNGRAKPRATEPATPRDTRPNRFTYALKGYTVEINARGWFIAENWFASTGEKPKWIGPFPTIELACLALARRLATEIADRHSNSVTHHKVKPTEPLYGLKGSLSIRSKKGEIA